MAGCLGCREGNVSPEDVERWTERLSNVLRSTRARNRFKSYLTDNGFNDGRLLVEFWEMCDTFLNSDAEPVLVEAQRIAHFAEDNIPFDAEMIRLRAAIGTTDTREIRTALSEAKLRAETMLEPEYYRKFCQHLQGLLGN